MIQETTASNRRTMNSLERRKRYQELIDQGHDLALRTQTQKAVDIFQGVSSILMQTNSLMQQGIEHERMDNASEVCMNVQVVKMSHDLVGAALQQNESSQFCDDEFAAAIMTYVGTTDSQEGWESIGEEGITAFRMSKHSSCLLGTFKFQSVPIEKVVKERRRRQRQELGEARKPETVHKLNQEEADARKLQDIMEQLKNIYEERGSSIPYYELVTDPTDYMCTVDTAFQISFLIRDGAVALETVENVLCTRPTTDLEKKQSKSSDDNIQAILSLNWTQWKNAIKQYRLTRPLLTIDRDLLDESNAGQ